jgi:hypothetical protein
MPSFSMPGPWPTRPEITGPSPRAGPGDAKEKRKISVINLYAMDLPITYAPIVHGHSKPFPTAFFGISPMKSTVLIVQCVYEKKYYDIMVLEVISWDFARIFADPHPGLT